MKTKTEKSSTSENSVDRARVLVCDDQPIVRDAIAAIIDTSPSFRVVARTKGHDDTLEALDAGDIDLVVLDIRLSGPSGLDVARAIRDRALPIHVLLLTGFISDEILLEAQEIGVDGIMDKSAEPEDFIERLTSIITGNRRVGYVVPPEVRRRLDERGVLALLSLNRTDLEILEALGQGLTDKQIGQRVYLSSQTIRNRVSRMLSVLGRENRTQLALLFSGLDESARKQIFASH